MIKVWCEECGVTGELDGYYTPAWFKICRACSGNGYTEHKGTLGDLELAQAVKEIFKLPLSYIVPSTHSVSIGTIEELIKWYRDQKGDK